ncbi:unnamed protein product [Symbiodinium sp. CCMP2592]|nr:unnamed protein product [Symbiodinium sp. CCMP2592]
MSETLPFVCAEEGSVEIVELSWPMLQDLEIDQAPEACLAYAVMRRPGGFLLCVPSGFFRASDLLAGQSANEDSALMGPSIEYLVISQGPSICEPLGLCSAKVGVALLVAISATACTYNSVEAVKERELPALEPTHPANPFSPVAASPAASGGLAMTASDLHMLMQRMSEATQAASAAAQAAATASSSSGMVGTRPFGLGDLSKIIPKPESFKPASREEEYSLWPAWSWSMEQYLACLDPEFSSELLRYTKQSEPVRLEDMSDQTKARARLLYGVLNGLLYDRGRRLLRSVVGQNGYESWRLLSRDLMPQSRNRVLALLRTISAWPAFDAKQGLSQQLVRLETAFEEYERLVPGGVPENHKMATLLGCLSGQLRQHANVVVTDDSSYHDLRELVLRWDGAQTRWSSSVAMRLFSPSTTTNVVKIIPLLFLIWRITRPGVTYAIASIDVKDAYLEVPQEEPVMAEAGDWARADDPAPVPCVVVDLAFRAADAVTQADLADTGARPFLADRPDTFPLASEVVRKCRSWVAEDLAGIRSGYHTAVSEAPARAAKLGARPKKTTVAQLAAQQESFAKALAGISEQLALLAKPPSVEQGAVDGGPAAPLPRAAAPPTSALLSAPVSGKAPQQGFPAKALSSLLGPPPRAKAAPTPVIHQLEEDDPLHLETGGAQEAGGTNTPVAEPCCFRAERWLNSQRMQSELALREGHFATRMRAAALRRMAPTALEPAMHQEGLMTRYLERFGGYQGQQLVGLLQWQLAQISDMLAADSPQGAADLAAQAMIMLEQVAVDRGRHELGWLFTLQPDPPVSLFATHQATPTAALRPFAPLADAKLVSCTIAFMKELDTLSAKRLELSGAKGKPPPAPPPTDDGGTPEPPLSKKQQRARAWAAAKKETILPLVRLWDQKGLPPGSLLTQVSVSRFTSVLVGASTDRADFYHQALISDARAASNCIGPPLSVEDLQGTAALARLLKPPLKRKCSLLAGLHDRSRFYAAFGTLFQGDHGGVEYATSAHQALLREHGLLHPGSRLLGQHAVPRTPCYEALVIDDYFSLSVECLDDFAECPSEALPQKLLQAESTQRVLTQAAYASEDVQGSPAKDLLGALTYQVAGAYVDSSVQSVREGQILVGAPPGKRLALAFLSLKASPLPGISKELAAAFSGSWTSALLFRKPLAACLGSFFKLGLGHVSGHPGSDVVPLSRTQAQELVLLAVLSPIAVSNVALPHSKRIFCTDASLKKGAVVSARVSRPVAEALWAHASRRGQYTLLSGTTSALDPTDACPSTAPSWGLTGRGPATESTLESPVGLDALLVLPLPRGSLTFFFILSQTAAFAHSSACCVPPGAFPWISHRDRSLRKQADTSGKKERRALRALVLLRTCASYGVPCILVHQRKSGICRHPSFLRCLELQTATSGSYRGCVFGGPGTSDLGWVAVWTPTPGLDRKCTCKFHEKGNDRSVFPSFSSEGARAIVSCLWAGAQLVEPSEEPACGLESALVNDVLLTSRWRADRTWRWRQRRHINVLESEAALQLYKDLVVHGGDLRFSLLTDSSVVLGSHRKGRSTAFLLAPSLRRASAILLAGGLYPSLQFAPTRLNPADDRHVTSVAAKRAGSLCMRRLTPGPLLASATCQEPAPIGCFSAFSTLTPPSASQAKAQTPPTFCANADVLLASFPLVDRRPFDHEAFCEYLVAFGNDLYASGRPYWHFAETINSLTSLKPSLRRQVQGAWDLAYTWLAEEPYVHHTAMPAQVLVAVLSTCLLWGWIKEAGIFALCWGALLRAGEAVKATRRDVVFPSDALWGQTYVLIKIQEPKTRGRAARHQSAKLEPYDLIEVCRLAFEALPKGAKLGPMTPQTLRRRLYDVLTRLGMPRSGGSERPLDLGSLRPGGATYLLQQTEDSELVRRRGRWISHRVMEIYLQEVSASTFLADLAPTARELVLAASSAFPDLLRKARDWTRAGIPPAVWFSLWPHL